MQATPTTADPPPASDGSLVRRYSAGQDAAATELYRRYARRLRGLVARHCRADFGGRFDPDDVTQSVFRTFFTGAKEKVYTVPATGEIWGLLAVLALGKVRNLIEHHTAAKRDVRHTVAAPDSDTVAEPDEQAATLLRMVVEEQIEAFPHHGRPIIRLRLEGYDVNEIAARTGSSPRTVERILQRFRACISDA